MIILAVNPKYPSLDMDVDKGDTFPTGVEPLTPETDTDGFLL